jgi:hypothetical protein
MLLIKKERMGVFYILNEYSERYHPNISLGKKFARTVILGFIFYYLLYFILPLWIPERSSRIQHFLRYLIVVDIISSSIFYGGMLNSISFWSTGKTINIPQEDSSESEDSGSLESEE